MGVQDKNPSIENIVERVVIHDFSFPGWERK